MAPVATQVRGVVKESGHRTSEHLKPMTYVVSGYIKDPSFQLSRMVAQAAAEKHPKLVQIQIVPQTEFEFNEHRHILKKKYPKLIDNQYNGCCIEIDGKHLRPVPEYLKWMQERYDVEDNRPPVLLEAIAKTAFSEFLVSLQPKHTIVYMDFSVDGVSAGRVLIELFDDVCPKTVKNFLRFVLGAGKGPHDIDIAYKGTKASRLVKQGWIQAGDIVLPQGNVFQEEFLADENFVIPHAHRGIVSMVNQGPNSNYSAFMFTLKSMPYFDKKYVAFGRLIDGESTLAKLESVSTRFEKPCFDIEITDTGIYKE